jgi:hypothetical protein
MRELVEDHACERVVVPSQHAAQDRIGEPAERRISRRAFDRGVVAFVCEPRRLALGVVAIEEAEIGDAARERKAVRDGIDREFRRRENIPGHVRPAEIDVGRIAPVARQSEMVRCETPRFERAGETLSQARIGTFVLDDPFDRTAMDEQRGLARADMRVIAQRSARRRRETRKRDEDETRDPVRRRDSRASTHGSRTQALRPSCGTIFSVEGSTPSRQRTFIAAISLPFRSFPMPNGATPQVGQN